MMWIYGYLGFFYIIDPQKIVQLSSTIIHLYLTVQSELDMFHVTANKQK